MHRFTTVNVNSPQTIFNATTKIWDLKLEFKNQMLRVICRSKCLTIVKKILKRE